MTKRKSIYILYRCNHHRPNYIDHISNNITLFKKNIFDLKLVKSANIEPTDIEGPWS